MIIIPILLEKGDIFKRTTHYTKYRVKKVEDGEVWYSNISGNFDFYKMGVNSKLKLELLEDGDFGDIDNIGKIMTIRPEQLTPLEEAI